MRARGLQSTVRRERGFTLIEMLVVDVHRRDRLRRVRPRDQRDHAPRAQITSESVTQNQARTALNQLTRTCARQPPPSTDTSPFVTTGDVMSPTTITFYAPDSSYSAGDPTTTTCARSPTSSRAATSSARRGQFEHKTARRGRSRRSESWVTLVPGVVNSVTFVYYDGNQPPAVDDEPGGGPHRRRHAEVAVPGTTQSDYSSEPQRCARRLRHEQPPPQPSRRVRSDDGAGRLRDRAPGDDRGLAHRCRHRARHSRAARRPRATPPTRPPRPASTAYASYLLDDQLYFLALRRRWASRPASRGGITGRAPRRRPPRGRGMSPGRTRSARTTGASSATATPTTSRSRPRAGRRPRSSRRSRSSRPAAAGTRPRACGAEANTAKRTIQTLLLPSSAANFQMIANEAITYGPTATTNGKIYSTGTVEHDGHGDRQTSTRRSTSSARRAGSRPDAQPKVLPDHEPDDPERAARPDQLLELPHLDHRHQGRRRIAAASISTRRSAARRAPWRSSSTPTGRSRQPPARRSAARTCQRSRLPAVPRRPSTCRRTERSTRTRR